MIRVLLYLILNILISLQTKLKKNILFCRKGTTVFFDKFADIIKNPLQLFW